MAGGEKFIQREVERLEREVTPKQYCFLGKWIKFVNGPASRQFDEHVSECVTCETALENERPTINQ